MNTYTNDRSNGRGPITVPPKQVIIHSVTSNVHCDTWQSNCYLKYLFDSRHVDVGRCLNRHVTNPRGLPTFFLIISVIKVWLQLAFDTGIVLLHNKCHMVFSVLILPSVLRGLGTRPVRWMKPKLEQMLRCVGNARMRVHVRLLSYVCVCYS